MSIPTPKKVVAQPVYDEKGLKIMTKKYLRDLCEELELYTTPSLNDKLYVHYKGFSRIDALDEYTNLTALYLDHNCIREIENLHYLTQLTCLYLQNNLITQINNLDSLKNLMTLNLAHNKITMVENLDGLPKLQSLNLSHNYLLNVESIEKLVECQSLRSVDLSNNETQYGEKALSVFTGLKNLSCLYLRENPVKRGISNYRKTMICSIPTLVFLDERPVTENDRRIAEAWQRGGPEAEEQEKVKIFQEKSDKHQANLLENMKMQERAMERKKSELERLEKEAKEKKEELLKKQEMLLKEKPEGWEEMVESVKKEIEETNKYLKIDENVQDEKVINNYAGINKFRCMMRKKGDNGEDIYLNATKEEVEAYLESQRLKREREAELLEQAENEAAGIVEADPKVLKDRNQEEKTDTQEVKKVEKPEEVEFKWTSEWEDILEGLIEENFFDFQKVADQMNLMIKKGKGKSEESKNGKGVLGSVSADDIRKKWTEIELKYREDATA